jgi:hypothetical protein
LVLTGLPDHEPFAFMSVLVLFHVMFAAWATGDPSRATMHAVASHEQSRKTWRRDAAMGDTSQRSVRRQKQVPTAEREEAPSAPR